MVGYASWTRRQLVVLDPRRPAAWLDLGAGPGRRPHRRRAVARPRRWPRRRRWPPVSTPGRTGRGARSPGCAAWNARAWTPRRSPRTTCSAGWLEAAGYARRRRWLHMSRPVDPTELHPPLREGVTVRRVARHENGVPLASDLQIVHLMLEESFQDHFNSYRESFPEFVQRLREDPGHRWDHWWLALVSTPLDRAGGSRSRLARPPGGGAGRRDRLLGAGGRPDRRGGHLRRLHRGEPSRARPRRRQGAALHGARGRGRAGPRPGLARGRRGLADPGRRALRGDGLGDRLRDRVVVPRRRRLAGRRQ